MARIGDSASSQPGFPVRYTDRNNSLCRRKEWRVVRYIGSPPGRIALERGFHPLAGRPCTAACQVKGITAPGASVYFLGVISYDDRVKRAHQVPPALIVGNGFYECLAMSAHCTAPAEASVVHNGVVGPSGGTDAKPVVDSTSPWVRPQCERVEQYFVEWITADELGKQSVEAALHTT